MAFKNGYFYKEFIIKLCNHNSSLVFHWVWKMTWQSLTTNLLLVGIISNAAYYYLVGTQKCRKSMTSKLELFEQRWQTETFKGIYDLKVFDKSLILWTLRRLPKLWYTFAKSVGKTEMYLICVGTFGLYGLVKRECNQASLWKVLWWTLFFGMFQREFPLL